MKKIFLLLCYSSFLYISPVFAQDVLLEQSLANDTISNNKGPNKKNFAHFFIGLGLTIGQPEKKGADIITGLSQNYQVGYRHKFKINNFYSFGGELFYQSIGYRLKQDSAKLLPNNVLHDKESISIKSLNGAIYNRINVGKRGNYIGNFIDIGAFAGWNFTATHNSVDKHQVANNAGASVTEVINRGLIFTEDFQYGLHARIGFNKIVFWCSYRLSNTFKAKYIYPQMPPLTAGIQIGLHK